MSKYGKSSPNSYETQIRYSANSLGPQNVGSAGRVPLSWYSTNGTQEAPASMKPQRKPGNSSGIRLATMLRKATSGGSRPCVNV